MNTINPIVHQVAGGRRLGARSIVLQNLSSLYCNVFEKVLDDVNNQQQRHDYIFGDEVEMLSKGDEHAFSYKEKGYAKLLFDHFAGGKIYADEQHIDSMEESIYAQIEPINPDLTGREQLIQMPNWKIASNDIIAIYVKKDFMLYLEVVGIQGQALGHDYGVKYVLNKRDDFNHIEPMNKD